MDQSNHILNKDSGTTSLVEEDYRKSKSITDLQKINLSSSLDNSAIDRSPMLSPRGTA
jgi:hypothetical protein